MGLSNRIREHAIELGFDLVGLGPVQAEPTVSAYTAWLDRGYHAGMAWMAKSERRSDPNLVLPGVRSVVAVGRSCYVDEPPEEMWNDPSRGRIARYAWGPDYHDDMTPRLKKLAAFIHQESGASARYYVDTGPVLERAYAARAGLGFIGRNAMLISPQYSSLVLLGEVLVDQVLEYDQGAAPDLASLPFTDQQGHKKSATCGSCHRCLDACPTGAFTEPYTVDSNRCISYLTIEAKDAIPEPLRSRMGNWIFGCDACQSVCPWVHRYARPSEKPFLAFRPEQCAPSLLELMAMDQDAFRERFRRTPVVRAKRRGLLRNVAVALGNWGDPQALPVLEKATCDPEPLIAEHARWAVEKIRDG